MQNRKNKWTIAALSCGHFTNDAYSNLLSPLLPPLIEKLHFSLTQAGILGGMYIFSSSLLQPLYGHLGDRYVHRAFALYGPLLTVVSMSLLGLASSYGWLTLLLLIAGIGIASFHPQGAALVSQASHPHRSLGMSIFVASGSLGYALGPSLVAIIVFGFGLEHSYLAAIPGLVLWWILFRFCPRDISSIREQIHSGEVHSLAGVRRSLAILSALVILRSAVQFGLSQFLPLYYTQQGYSLQRATACLTFFLLSGGVGGFFGGYLSRRLGARKVIQFSMLLASPILLAFLFLPGIWSLLSLALTGFVLLSTLPVNVVMAQELAPHRTSTVSALTMGFSWGFGGIVFVPISGYIGEHFGLHAAYLFLVALPILGYLLSLGLPRDIPTALRAAVSPPIAPEGHRHADLA